MKHYTDSLEKEPTNEIVLGNIAMVHLKLGNNEECINFCDKAIKRI